MATAAGHMPLDMEDLIEEASPEVAAARAPRRPRHPASWKVLAASAAAGLGLLGAGAAAAAWRGGGGGGGGEAARQAVPMGEFIAESEAKGEKDEKEKQEKPKFHHRPMALKSVPVTNATLPKMGKVSSAIKINEDGKINTYYLPGANVIDDGMTVKYRPPYRFYLMKTDTTDYSKAENFYKPIFPGKTFAVDMDFHGENGPSCGCNINFYLVDMPVSFPGKDKDYYCDAQCFPDMGCCHEFDMNEGNENVQQITNHACTSHYSQDSSWKCNKWGDPEVKITPPEFGKSSSNKICGKKKFTFSQRFDVSGSDLTITTTISQGNNHVVKKAMHSNGEMQDMLKKLNDGMAFVTGYWTAPDMNWMDGESCGGGTEHCSEEPAYISNWRITTNDGPAPSPSPSPNPSPSPSPNGPMTCGWCESGSCSRCNEEPGWCSESEDHCRQCGAKSKWCPKSAVTLGKRSAAKQEADE